MCCCRALRRPTHYCLCFRQIVAATLRAIGSRCRPSGNAVAVAMSGGLLSAGNHSVQQQLPQRARAAGAAAQHQRRVLAIPEGARALCRVRVARPRGPADPSRPGTCHALCNSARARIGVFPYRLCWQHVPRYQLHLDNISRQMPPEGGASSVLRQALTVVRDIGCEVRAGLCNNAPVPVCATVCTPRRALEDEQESASFVCGSGGCAALS